MKAIFLFILLFYSYVGGADPYGAEDVGSSQAEQKNTTTWVKVYKYNTDEENCDQMALIPHDTPHAMQKSLDEQNILVRSSLRGHDGLMYSLSKLSCVTMPTISIFEIPEEHYSKAKLLGFQLCHSLKERGGGCYSSTYSDHILPDKNQKVRRVYKYAGHKQCQDNSLDIGLMEQELLEAKIVVFQRYNGVDGLLHSFSCGSETGKINIYVIEKSALAKALSLGYRECAYLEETGGVCRHLSSRFF